MRPDDDFDTLLSTIEQHRKEWLSEAPAAHVAVSVRSESLTIRMTKEEVEALELGARKLGIGKSSLVRIFLRQYLGLSDATREAAATEEHGASLHRGVMRARSIKAITGRTGAGTKKRISAGK